MERQRYRKNWVKWGILAAPIVLLFLVPLFITSRYWLHVLIMMGVYIIATASWRYITTSGEWSFGHAALMGMGGYASTLLVMRLGLSWWLAMPLSILATMLISIIIYYPCLRTTKTFFFFSSWAFSEVMRLTWVQFKNPFGGIRGIGRIPPPDSIRIPGLPVVNFTALITKEPYYYLVLVFTILSILIMYRLEKSHLGSIASAMSDSKVLASFAGIRVWWYQMVILAIASGFAALAGSLVVHYQGWITPADFSYLFAININIFGVVGGIGHWAGPILGVAVFGFIRELLRPWPRIVPLIYGAILAATLVFMPEGLVSLPRRVSPWVKKGLEKIRRG